METIEIILLILIDILAFLIGLILGRLTSKRQEQLRKRDAVRKNNDWHELLYYTPGEPTVNSVIKYKGD